MSLLCWLLNFFPIFTTILSVTIDATGFVYRDLIGTDSTAFAAEVNSWTKTSSTSPYYSTCSGSFLMGGPSIGGSFSKTYNNLPNHDIIQITFKLYAVDTWTSGSSVVISIGGKSINFASATTIASNPFLCGGSSRDFGISLGRVVVFHTASSLSFSFSGSGMNSDLTLQSFGVREINILLMNKTVSDVERTCYIIPSGNTYAGGNTCPCTSYSQTYVGSCSLCPTVCSTCSDTVNVKCLTCAADAYPAAGSTYGCLTCPAECATCISATKCTSCASGYYLYKGECVQCANPPMDWDGVSCSSICTDPGQLIYWDQTCMYNCDPPLEIYSVNGYDVCAFPCNSGEYLYQNGSCLSSCVIPYYDSIVQGEHICYTPCRDQGLYENDDYSCSLDCPSPYIITNYGWYNHCSVPCPTDQFFYQNQTCLSVCNAPFTSRMVDVYQFCDLCSHISDFYNQNGSCSSTCSPPFTQRISNGYSFCDFPCSSGQFLLSDGSCSSTCPTPFVQSGSSPYKNCSTPCPTGFALKNGTCVTSCPLPWVSTTTPYKLCDTPCTGSYAYSDATCKSSCLTPLVPINYYYNYCQSPCSTSTFYSTSDGSCMGSCSAPNTQNITIYVNSCIIATPSQPNSSNSSNFSNTSSPSNSTNTTNTSNNSGNIGGNTTTNRSNTTNHTNTTKPPIKVNTEDVGIVSLQAAKTSLALQSFSTSAATVTAAIGATQGNGVSAFGMITLNRFLFYTRFLKIKFPTNLYNYFVLANKTGYLNLYVSFPTGDMEFPTPVRFPSNFENWDVTSNFISNYWQTFSTIVMSIGIAFGLWGIEILAKWRKNKDARFFFENLNVLFKWNFALIQFCTGYDSITLYSSIEFRTYKFTNAVSVASFSAAIICVIFMFVFLGLTYKLAKGYHIAKNQVLPEGLQKRHLPSTQFMNKWRAFQILFAGYKDDSVLAQGLIFFFMVRNMFWISIIAFMYEHPLAQCLLMVIMSTFMLVIMLIKKPFLNLVSKFEIPALEGITLFVQINVMALAFMDEYNLASPDVRYRIGSAIVLGFTAFGVVAFAAMISYFILGFYLTYKAYKQMKAAGAVSFFLLISIPFVSYGMDFKEVEDDEGETPTLQKLDKLPFMMTSLASTNPFHQTKEMSSVRDKEVSDFRLDAKDPTGLMTPVSVLKLGTFSEATMAENLTSSGDTGKSHGKFTFDDVKEENDRFKKRFTQRFANQRRNTSMGTFLVIPGQSPNEGEARLARKESDGNIFNFNKKESDVSKADTGAHVSPSPQEDIKTLSRKATGELYPFLKKVTALSQAPGQGDDGKVISRKGSETFQITKKSTQLTVNPSPGDDEKVLTREGSDSRSITKKQTVISVFPSPIDEDKALRREGSDSRSIGKKATIFIYPSPTNEDKSLRREGTQLSVNPSPVGDDSKILRRDGSENYSVSMRGTNVFPSPMLSAAGSPTHSISSMAPDFNFLRKPTIVTVQIPMDSDPGSKPMDGSPQNMDNFASAIRMLDPRPTKINRKRSGDIILNEKSFDNFKKQVGENRRHSLIPFNHMKTIEEGNGVDFTPTEKPEAYRIKKERSPRHAPLDDIIEDRPVENEVESPVKKKKS